MLKPLKLLLIIAIIFFLYKGFVSPKEDFALSTGSIVTNNPSSDLNPGIYYKRGTLKPGISNTKTQALNGGSTCMEFPQTVYFPIAPVDAVCNFGTNNINAYNQINETLAQCPIVSSANGVTLTSPAPYKTLNKVTDVNAFNLFTTIDFPQYGGKDCFTQRQAALPSTYQFPCTSTIPSSCDLSTVTKVYNPDSVADSFSACSITGANGWNKAISKWSNADIDAKATIRQGINGGASCSAQAALMPATTKFICGPINATCQGNEANVDSNYNITNVSGTTTPVIDKSSFWSTCRPSGASFTLTETAAVCCSKSAATSTVCA